jgi:hypothetical protein
VVAIEPAMVSVPAFVGSAKPNHKSPFTCYDVI